MTRPAAAWNAAHWCRANGLTPGALVGAANQAAGFSYAVYCLTHVGRELVVGACLGTVYPRGRRACGPPSIEAGGDYEHAWGFASQLFAPPDAEADAVVAWLERGD